MAVPPRFSRLPLPVFLPLAENPSPIRAAPVEAGLTKSTWS